MKVAIIAGHGLKYPGAVNSRLGLNEHEIVQQIVHHCGDQLNSRGVNWVSCNGSLFDKVELCNVLEVDLAVEVHLNSVRDSTIGGAEVLIANLNSRSGPIAQQIQENLVELGLKDRGVKVGYFRGNRKKGLLYFLRMTKMPAIIVECFFLSNDNEAQQYSNRITDIAKTIVNGITNQEIA